MLQTKEQRWLAFMLLVNLVGLAFWIPQGVILGIAVNFSCAMLFGRWWVELTAEQQAQAREKRIKGHTATLNVAQTVGERAIAAYMAAAPDNHLAHAEFYDAAIATPPDEWDSPVKSASEKIATIERENMYQLAQSPIYQVRSELDSTLDNSATPSAVVTIASSGRPRLTPELQQQIINYGLPRINIKQERCILHGGHFYLVGEDSCVQCGYDRSVEGLPIERRWQ